MNRAEHACSGSKDSLSFAFAMITLGLAVMSFYTGISGFESTFFWYVTVVLAIAFIASLIMPNPRVHGYLDGAGTVEERWARSRLARA